jgi:hypothetical protein
MSELSKPITDKLIAKGFTPLEIPELLNDLIHLISEDKRYTTNSINQELENLGWGIQIIDEPLIKEISRQLLVSTEDTLN